MSGAKVYTVNGAAPGAATSLPDWLTRKRAQKIKGSRGAVKEQVEGAINVIQSFEFPEASYRIKVTRDGHHAIATGTYKPQVKCFDLDQLTQKFERHTDAENVDFALLSDDWTKSVHLQADRTEVREPPKFLIRLERRKFSRIFLLDPKKDMNIEFQGYDKKGDRRLFELPRHNECIRL